MTSVDEVAARREELASNLHRVQERIAAACRVAGRLPREVTLIVVTKFFPASDIESLALLGVTAIGESRDQEARVKIAALPGEVRERLHIHFVGQLQSNKVASLSSYCDTVHSVDRVKLVGALDGSASAAGRDLGALIQVSLSSDPGVRGRGGIAPSGVAQLAERFAAMHHLTLRGIMAVAPVGVDPSEAFALLATVARAVRADHPGATWISAGMSADLESAIVHGATHLRVGSAILGSRPPLG